MSKTIESVISAVALKASPEDERDYVFTPAIPVADLPSNIDQGPQFPRVQNQTSIGICTGETITTLCERVENTARPYEPGVTERSRRFNYRFSRLYDGLTGDSGATPRSMCRSARNYGLPHESSWPFSTNIDEEPPQSVMDEAAQSKLGRYELLNPVRDSTGEMDWRGTRDLMRQAMAEGCGVALAFRVRRWMVGIKGQLGSSGHLPPAMDVTDLRNEILGGHIVPVRRIDMDLLPDNGGAIVIHNSWGTAWGDGGLWSMPAIMLSSSAFYMECRVIRGFAGIEVAPVAETLTPDEKAAHLSALAELGIWPAPHVCTYPAVYEYLRRRGLTDKQICEVVGVSRDDLDAFKANAPLSAWVKF